jgi:cytidine deaminase
MKNGVFWDVTPCGPCKNQLLVTVMKEALSSSEASVLTRADYKSYVRFEVFTAMAMKNGVFWDVTPCGSCKNQLLVTVMKEALSSSEASVLTRADYKSYIRFEVFTAMTMKNGVFWDVTPCGTCKNQLLVTVMKEALISSEASVLTRATRRNIPEDTIQRELCLVDLSNCPLYVVVILRAVTQQSSLHLGMQEQRRVYHQQEEQDIV